MYAIGVEYVQTNEIRHSAVRGNETVIWRIPGVVHDIAEVRTKGTSFSPIAVTYC